MLITSTFFTTQMTTIMKFKLIKKDFGIKTKHSFMIVFSYWIKIPINFF